MWVSGVAVLGVLAFVLFRGGGGLGGPDNTIPQFDFKVTKAIPMVVTQNDPNQFTGQAQAVATEVTKTMTALYTGAFLDPENWRSGSYGDVWPLFDDGSRTSAQQDGATITLGPNAGDTYEKVKQPKGTIGVKVLLDKQDRPSTAVAIVKFTALGTGKDGTFTRIVSRGQYFLRLADGGWTVYAFQVRRGDHVTTPKPGPSGSSSEVAP
ncbi:MAG: hypothetical protein AB1551_05785 [Actinomycetota bacterium]